VSAIQAQSLDWAFQDFAHRTLLLVSALPTMYPHSHLVALLPQHGIVVSGIVADTRWPKSIVAKVLMFSLGLSLVLWVATPRAA
jgi:hypothetical protein